MPDIALVKFIKNIRPIVRVGRIISQDFETLKIRSEFNSTRWEVQIRLTINGLTYAFFISALETVRCTSSTL